MMTARAYALSAAMAVGFWGFGVTGLSQLGDGASAFEGQAIAVGDVLSRNEVHIITEHGHYGLGRKVGGSEYAVARGMLIRIDPMSMKVLSILRVQDVILD